MASGVRVAAALLALLVLAGGAKLAHCADADGPGGKAGPSATDGDSAAAPQGVDGDGDGPAAVTAEALKVFNTTDGDLSGGGDDSTVLPVAEDAQKVFNGTDGKLDMDGDDGVAGRAVAGDAQKVFNSTEGAALEEASPPVPTVSANEHVQELFNSTRDVDGGEDAVDDDSMDSEAVLDGDVEVDGERQLGYRRQHKYDPTITRDGASAHPDDVFRASYQPSHILTFELQSGKPAQFYASLTAGQVVRGDFFVARGGARDMHIEIASPSQAASSDRVYSHSDALSGIFMFTAAESGEYAITLRNRASTYTTKRVSLAWLVGADADDNVGKLPFADQRTVQPLGQAVHRIHQRMDSIVSSLAYQNVRFQRNVELEASTSTRIAYSTAIETIVFLAVIYLQVTYIRKLVNRAVGWV